jgi:hypothetical protein
MFPSRGTSAHQEQERTWQDECERNDGEDEPQPTGLWIGHSGCHEHEQTKHVCHGRPIDRAETEPVFEMQAKGDEDNHGSETEGEARGSRRFWHGANVAREA